MSLPSGPESRRTLYQSILAEAWQVADGHAGADPRDVREDTDERGLSSADYVRLVSEILVSATQLKWPQGATVADIARFARADARFDQEGSSVQPMTAEAVIRAANGDARSVLGVGALDLVEHIGVAIRLLVQDLSDAGVTAEMICEHAMELAGRKPSSGE